jgi:hypothetical protein
MIRVLQFLTSEIAIRGKGQDETSHLCQLVSGEMKVLVLSGFFSHLGSRPIEGLGDYSTRFDALTPPSSIIPPILIEQLSGI